MAYTCSLCMAKVVVLKDVPPIKPCKCKAPIIAHLYADLEVDLELLKNK